MWDVATAVLISVCSNSIFIAIVNKLWDGQREKARAERAADIGLEKTAFEDMLSNQRSLFNDALSKKAFEHQTVYPRLHDKSLITVTESYVLLAVFTEAVIRYTDLMKNFSGGPTDAEMLPKVAEAFDNFRRHFYGYRIFLPEKAAIAIDVQVQVLVSAANVYKHAVHHKIETAPVDWTMIYNKIELEMRPATRELEKIYRTLVRIEAVFPGFDSIGELPQ
jgi:hypothetical protein